MKCFEKYKLFFLLIEMYPCCRKLVSELLHVYISNNDSFPSMFFLNNNYSEKDISSILQFLKEDINVKWISKIQPIRQNNSTCVKVENQ